MRATAEQLEGFNTAFVHDEAAFRREIPYALESTSLKGVYLNPVPPDDFDAATASQADLTRQGLMYRKPVAGGDPAVQALWDHHVAHKWLAKDRIVPEFEVQVGVTHELKSPLRKQTNGSYLGTQWAGAGGQTGHWVSIIGEWHVPTVSKPTEAQGTEGGWNSSSWLGLDGFNVSNDVAQIGVEQKVDAHGNASYVAWYEWFAPLKSNSPAYRNQVNITNIPVKPNDWISCGVQYIGTTAARVTFGNVTTGKNFSLTLAPPPGANFNGSSYEWIMEAPDSGEPVSALPKFTPVQFLSMAACGPGNTPTAHPNSADTTNIETAGGKILTSVAVTSSSATITFIG